MGLATALCARRAPLGRFVDPRIVVLLQQVEAAAHFANAHELGALVVSSGRAAAHLGDAKVGKDAKDDFVRHEVEAIRLLTQARGRLV